ncbi:HAMP domain-containing histidine kinase [Sphingopyxis flava]|uniref:HAMP domain-containing histidine kinase n=1 Tax=Sphingopyxis flava TaxID=1507287 RepID=UPI0009A8D4D1|nr:HAMP domain-containing histidine kinase [Sphingopyxis flava]
MVNLTRNAISASTDRLVLVTVYPVDTEVRIEVSNHISIVPESDGAGMGVGLIIARTIVDGARWHAPAQG